MKFLAFLGRSFFWISAYLSLFAVCGIALASVWGYRFITRDLPTLNRIEDYNPPAATQIYSYDGSLIGEFYDERRYPVRLKEVPLKVRQAFIASEDASFYSHPGIDLVSIFRAFLKNLSAGSKKQGGSTITQQVVKQLLLSPEKDYRRKIKEAILSYRIEQKLSKDEILEIYLNQMFFGNTAYGIQAAAQMYFHKDVGELSLAESAILAGLLVAPSSYSPVNHYDRARKRQLYVIDRMFDNGFITQDEVTQAKAEELTIYRARNVKVHAAPYYVGEVRKELIKRLGSERAVDVAGLKVVAGVDLTASTMAKRALRKSLRELTKRRGWRGPKLTLEKEQREEFRSKVRKSTLSEFSTAEVYDALVTEVNPGKQQVLVELFGEYVADIRLKNTKWAHKHLGEEDAVTWGKPITKIRVGDVIEVALKGDILDTKASIAAQKDKIYTEFQLDQSPQVEGALVLLDPHSGRVVAMQGGYSYRRSVFNRVTQSLRQPGSSFKPVVYLAAVDGYGYTPSTIVSDEARTFRVGDQIWKPGNFDKKYLGGITLRRALEKSRNLVSADIISRIGVDAAIAYARRLGITAPLGRNLSLSLGSSEVTPLEMTRSYGVFAAKGVLFDSVFITQIEDRRGTTVYDFREELVSNATQAIPASSAFVLANMMKGVVERGTGWKIRELKRPAAGKTGTSNDQMDAWFIGYTPEWVCGAWGGFDVKKTIGKKETGGRVSAPSFLYLMKPYLEHLDQKRKNALDTRNQYESERLGIEPEEIDFDPLDFSAPSGVTGYWINLIAGTPTSGRGKGSIYEYYISGTKPNAPSSSGENDEESYLDSYDL